VTQDAPLPGPTATYTPTPTNTPTLTPTAAPKSCAIWEGTGPVDIPGITENYWACNSIPIAVTQTGNIDLRYPYAYQADITVTLDLSMSGTEADDLMVELCPPAASIPAFPDFNWPFDDICVPIIDIDDLYDAECALSDVSFTDMYPDEDGHEIWQLKWVSCPPASGEYSTMGGFDAWSALIDEAGGQDINGTWRMWACTGLASGDYGDFTSWSMEICSENLDPTSTPTPTATPT